MPLHGPSMEPALVLTDRGEQTLLRLVLKDLLRQELDLSEWDPETYPTAAAALLDATLPTCCEPMGYGVREVSRL